MANHPNRSKKKDTPGRNPRPEEIRAAREAAGLTQEQAAALIYSTLRTWQDWEAGIARMHPAFWELWRIRSSGSTSHEYLRLARAVRALEEAVMSCEGVALGKWVDEKTGAVLREAAADAIRKA